MNEKEFVYIVFEHHSEMMSHKVIKGVYKTEELANEMGEYFDMRGIRPSDGCYYSTEKVEVIL